MKADFSDFKFKVGSVISHATNPNFKFYVMGRFVADGKQQSNWYYCTRVDDRGNHVRAEFTEQEIESECDT